MSYSNECFSRNSPHSPLLPVSAHPRDSLPTLCYLVSKEHAPSVSQLFPDHVCSAARERRSIHAQITLCPYFQNTKTTYRLNKPFPIHGAGALKPPCSAWSATFHDSLVCTVEMKCNRELKLNRTSGELRLVLHTSGRIPVHMQEYLKSSLSDWRPCRMALRQSWIQSFFAINSDW